MPVSLCSPPSLKGNTKTTFPRASTMQQHVQCFSPGKPIRDLVSKVFSGVGPIDILPTILECSRFPEGKQVFTINQAVYANGLSSVSHPSQLVNCSLGILPEPISQMLAEGPPSWQVFLSYRILRPDVADFLHSCVDILLIKTLKVSSIKTSNNLFMFWLSWITFVLFLVFWKHFVPM